jgi:hypothetical protein
MQERYDAASAYLDARKRLKRVAAWDLVERFGLSYVAARQLVHRKQYERGEIGLADLLTSERRAIVALGNLDLHALAAGPIMDSNEIYLPAGKLTLAEAKARESATILSADPASVDEHRNGEDPQGLRAKPASAVPSAETADAPPHSGSQS